MCRQSFSNTENNRTGTFDILILHYFKQKIKCILKIFHGNFQSVRFIINANQQGGFISVCCRKDLDCNLSLLSRCTVKQEMLHLRPCRFKCWHNDKLGRRAYFSAIYQARQPLLDSNQRIQQSKCCALPLGERAKLVIHPKIAE